MIYEVTREKLPDWIAQEERYASSIDEFGGHKNVLVNIIESGDGKIIYCGQKVPEELARRARNALEEHQKLREEIDRRLIPNLAKLITELHKSKWDGTILFSATIQGLVSNEEYLRYNEECDQLISREYIDRFKANADKIKRVQTDYIEFLKSILTPI